MIVTSDPLHNRNPVRGLQSLVEGLKEQTTSASWELVYIEQPGHDFGHAVQAPETTAPFEIVRGQSPRSGRSAGVNAGIALARGDLFILLAADFRPEPRWMDAHVSAHQRWPDKADTVVGPCTFPDADWTTAFMRWLDAQGLTFGVGFSTGKEPGPDYFYGGNTSIKRDFFETVGPFRENLDGYAGDDHDWGHRARDLGMNVRYAPAASCFHIHEVDLNDRLVQAWHSGRGRRLAQASENPCASVKRIEPGTIERHAKLLMKNIASPRRFYWHAAIVRAYLKGYRQAGDSRVRTPAY